MLENHTILSFFFKKKEEKERLKMTVSLERELRKFKIPTSSDGDAYRHSDDYFSFVSIIRTGGSRKELTKKYDLKATFGKKESVIEAQIVKGVAHYLLNDVFTLLGCRPYETSLRDLFQQIGIVTIQPMKQWLTFRQLFFILTKIKREVSVNSDQEIEEPVETLLKSGRFRNMESSLCNSLRTVDANYVRAQAIKVFVDNPETVPDKIKDLTELAAEYRSEYPKETGPLVHCYMSQEKLIFKIQECLNLLF